MAKVVKCKYNSTGERCVDACLNYGELRYINEDESPINIEVPFDKYDEAISDFNDRVKEGMTTESLEPSDILCRGKFTYIQSKNIANEGKVKGLNFYEIDGSVECHSILGVSASIEYALGIWNNDSKELATRKAVLRAIKIYGEQFIEVFDFDETVDVEEYKRFAKREHTTGYTVDIGLYKNKSYKIEEKYENHGIKEKISNNKNLGFGIGGGFLGFILIQVLTNYGQLVNDDYLFVLLNLSSILVFGLMFVYGSRALTERYIKDDNNIISEMFNEELENVIYENLLTEKEAHIIIKNITKGEVTKLLVNMKGSVNKKISSSNIVNKETKFVLDARKVIILPTEEEIKESLKQLVEMYNHKLEKEYNVSNL